MFDSQSSHGSVVSSQVHSSGTTLCMRLTLLRIQVCGEALPLESVANMPIIFGSFF